MRALAHPLRLRILEEMWDEGGPLRAADLAVRLSEPANSVSYHLRRLRDAGYVVVAAGPEGATARDRWYAAPERGISGSVRAEDPEAARSAFGAVLRTRYSQVAEHVISAEAAQQGPLLHIDGMVWLPKDVASDFVERFATLARQMRAAAEDARQAAAPDTEFTRYTVVADIVAEMQDGERLVRPASRVPDSSGGDPDVF